MSPDQDSWAVFDRDFGRDVREALLRGSIQIYPAAWEGVSSFTSRTAVWLQPLHRHALMRDTVIGVANRFEGVQAAVPKTDPPTTDYVSLRCGCSYLTLASVHKPKDLPRWALHRKTLAATINYPLFEGFEEPPAPLDEDAFMYALILLGPEVNYQDIQHRPAFIDIGIPAPDYECYVSYRSLYDEFPDVVEEATGAKPATIQQAYLRMRRRDIEGGQAS